MIYTISHVRSKKNLKLAYQRIIKNQESTYKNFFRDLYIAYNFSLKDNIDSLAKKMKVGYIPSDALKVYLPKSNGLSRMYTLLSIEDQVVYQAYCNIIAKAINNNEYRKRQKKSVFGNLYAGEESQFFYKNWQDSYKAFTKSIIKAYESGYDYIANFDLTACYDSINHVLLKDTLIENHISENLAIQFTSLLKHWESTSSGSLGIGIPQGPISSGIVAECILSKYDSFIEEIQKKLDLKYFRYVDDIKILARDKETAEWALFLLDKKSKELGLFPQASKVHIRKIMDINDEVKRISLPLFDDDISEDVKPEIAYKKLQKMIRHNSSDITTIRRLFGEVECNHKVNLLFIRTLKQYPNLIHTFAFYVARYPRQLPKSVTDYIYETCCNKTTQFASGLLLQASRNKLSYTDLERFVSLSKRWLKNKSTRSEIIDPLFRVELYGLCLQSKTRKKSLKKEISDELNWWEKKELLSIIDSTSQKSLLQVGLKDEYDDVALISAKRYIEDAIMLKNIKVADINNSAQRALKSARLIVRKKTNPKQINKCINIITDTEIRINWKLFLKNHYDAVEDAMFLAQAYWQTDLTSFINVWDTINDTIFDELSIQYKTILGGHNLGNFGFLESGKLKGNLPEFQKACEYIHNLRCHSPLSHMYISNRSIPQTDWKYTKAISSRERKQIKRLITNSLMELSRFLNGS